MIPMELILLLRLLEGRDLRKKKISVHFELSKRWLLFPPDSPIGQLQTRIPYEESSVYLDIQPSMLNKYQVDQFLFYFIDSIFSPRISMFMILLFNRVMYCLFQNIGGILSPHLIQ